MINERKTLEEKNYDLYIKRSLNIIAPCDHFPAGCIIKDLEYNTLAIDRW